MHVWQTELTAEELRRNPTQRNRDEHRKQTSMVATLSTRLRLGKISGRRHQTSEALETIAPRRRLWLVHPEGE
jgi:hypothetical protein